MRGEVCCCVGHGRKFDRDRAHVVPFTYVGRMSTLAPDTALTVHLHAVCARNQWASDPGPVRDELRQIAGDRNDLLIEAAGLRARYQDGDEHMRALADALLGLPGVDEWALGRRRRRAPMQSTP